MVKIRRLCLGLILICVVIPVPSTLADDRAGGASRMSEMPIMAVSSANIFEPDVSLPLIGKDDWRFFLTFSLSAEQKYLPGTDLYPRLHELELNFDAASGSETHNVALGADFDFRVHQHARIRMTYIRLNDHENYVEAFRQSVSTDPETSAEGSECAVVQLRIEF